MSDRRTRDQLRYSNEKLRATIRAFARIQDEYLRIHHESGIGVPADWLEAYRAMKELMGGSATPSPGEEKPK